MLVSSSFWCLLVSFSLIVLCIQTCFCFSAYFMLLTHSSCTQTSSYVYNVNYRLSFMSETYSECLDLIYFSPRLNIHFQTSLFTRSYRKNKKKRNQKPNSFYNKKTTTSFLIHRLHLLTPFFNWKLAADSGKQQESFRPFRCAASVLSKSISLWSLNHGDRFVLHVLRSISSCWSHSRRSN